VVLPEWTWDQTDKHPVTPNASHHPVWGEAVNGPEDKQEEELEPGELQRQIQFLEEETALLRRRLQDSPRQVRVLEEQLLETKGQLARALSQNERLAATLGEAREQIIALEEEVERLRASDPYSFDSALDALPEAVSEGRHVPPATRRRSPAAGIGSFAAFLDALRATGVAR
jgi:hypothetical protein